MPDVGVRVALELDDLFGDQSVCVHKAYTQAAVKSVALRASAVRKAPPHRPRPRSRSRGLSASTRPRQTTTCTPSPLSKNTCVHSLATPSFPGGQWEKKVLCQNRAARLENIYSREALGVSETQPCRSKRMRDVAGGVHCARNGPGHLWWPRDQAHRASRRRVVPALLSQVSGIEIPPFLWAVLGAAVAGSAFQSSRRPPGRFAV